MPNLLLSETLYKTTAEMLEQLAMMFLIPPEEATPPPSPAVKTVHIMFTGPFSGRLMLSASQCVLPALAGNMLGLDDTTSPSADQQLDALMEFANVVCGNLLPAITGTSLVYHVSAPQLADDTVESDSPPAQSARLYVNEGIVDVAIFIDDDSPDIACTTQDKRDTGD